MLLQNVNVLSKLSKINCEIYSHDNPGLLILPLLACEHQIIYCSCQALHCIFYKCAVYCSTNLEFKFKTVRDRQMSFLMRKSKRHE